MRFKVNWRQPERKTFAERYAEAKAENAAMRSELDRLTNRERMFQLMAELPDLRKMARHLR